MARWKTMLGAVVACVLAMSGIVGPADARIVCEKGFRVIKGRLLGTPYCQDLYLAEVAREFGVRVSAREILNNPNKKREVCAFMGWDIRVKHICDGVLPRLGPL